MSLYIGVESMRREILIPYILEYWYIQTWIFITNAIAYIDKAMMQLDILAGGAYI